jgi:hypothetical protein
MIAVPSQLPRLVRFRADKAAAWNRSLSSICCGVERAERSSYCAHHSRLAARAAKIPRLAREIRNAFSLSLTRIKGRTPARYSLERAV